MVVTIYYVGFEVLSGGYGKFYLLEYTYLYKEA
jgi:hypothetical protein